MFLSLNDFSLSRFRLAVPGFLVMWLCVQMGLGIFLLLAQKELKEQSVEEVNSSLSGYIQKNLETKQSSVFRKKSGGRDLNGLNFVRFVSGGEHVLLTQTKEEDVDFSHLIELRPEVSGAWLYIGDDTKKNWTVVSVARENGMIIQGGKLDNNRQQLFASFIGICFRISLGSFILLWLPALFMVKCGLTPLIELRDKIASSLAAGYQALSFKTRGKFQEVEELYNELNNLLEQNRQLIGEMQSSLDNVAHDLRTPMTRLRSVAEFGLQPDVDEKRLRESLSDCLEESERVLSMLRIMMSVAEAESGTMRLERQQLDAALLIDDVLALYEYVAEEKRVELKAEVETGCTILVDKTRFGQVLANLLDNAIKYSSENSQVKIRLFRDFDQVVIEVVDEGMGISENEGGQIWERLYRGDRSRSQKGLGLGLNYVKAVVESHGGVVEVQSVLRNGSVFSVRMPYHKMAIE